MIKIIAILFLCCQISMSTATSNHSVDHQDFQSNASQDCSPKWTMPLVKLGNKFYYFGTFYKASWYKAYQYCRFHGLQLATITSPEENQVLTKYILDLGFKEHYWVSGTDLGSEGRFVWMSTGDDVKYSDWVEGTPDNWKAPDGETDNCMCLWNSEGTLIKWTDIGCSTSLYFVCELNSYK